MNENGVVVCDSEIKYR